MIEGSTYSAIPAVASFLLENSYVLGITANPGEVSMVVDFVLTPEHPDYVNPMPNEQFCFRRGTLRFVGVHRLAWSNQGMPPAADATGEVDYGQFDSLALDPVGYVLDGSFGHMEISADAIEAYLDGS